MTIPVGLNVWSRLVEELFPYLDQVVGPFDFFADATLASPGLYVHLQHSSA